MPKIKYVFKGQKMIWPTLPSEYQRVEYIAANGAQYIDTNIQVNQNYTTEIKCKVDTYKEWNVVMGTRSKSGQTNTAYNRYYIRWQTTNNSFEVGRSTNNNVSTYETYSSTTYYNQNTHTIKLNRYLYVDGALVKTFTNDTSTGLFSYAPTLFAQRDPNTNPNPTDFFMGRIYYCKIWDDSGILKRNFVPCYRISDHTIGMYDLVEGVFYTNKGSGSFTKGGNI